MGPTSELTYNWTFRLHSYNTYLQVSSLLVGLTAEETYVRLYCWSDRCPCPLWHLINRMLEPLAAQSFYNFNKLKWMDVELLNCRQLRMAHWACVLPWEIILCIQDHKGDNYSCTELYLPLRRCCVFQTLLLWCDPLWYKSFMITFRKK